MSKAFNMLIKFQLIIFFIQPSFSMEIIPTLLMISAHLHSREMPFSSVFF